MKLKICGMKYAGNIREVSGLSPDYMGFIFYPGSKRYVGPDFAMPELNPEINKVGVFVNESLENILAMVRKHGLDLVQLHGDEPAEFCGRVQEHVKVIKAFGLNEHFDFSCLEEYSSCCEYFLFDSKTSGYGGSGKSFDRNILKDYKLKKPFFLSGGIDANIASGLRTDDPGGLFGIDVNSKFESEPGLKDLHKLKLLKDELSGK